MKYIYRIFVFLTVILLLGALGLTFIFMPRGKKLDENKKIINKEEVAEPEKITVFNDNEDIVNILLVGLDSSQVSYPLIQSTTELDFYPSQEIHTTR